MPNELMPARRGGPIREQRHDREQQRGRRLLPCAHGWLDDRVTTVSSLPRAENRRNRLPELLDVIVGGCCVLVAIYRRLAFEEILVSEADILDGLARSIAQ